MTENQTPYVPIACGAHDELLHLATMRQECELAYADGQHELARIRGIIVDVYSQGGAEYLKLRDGTTLRLDHLWEIDGRPIERGTR